MKQATVYEILQLAIHMEEEGQKFYEKYAKKTDDKVREVFLKLASDEVKHSEYFQKLYDSLESQNDDFFFEEEVVNFFNSYAKSAAFAREIKDMDTRKEVIEEGLSSERKTIHFYEQLEKYAEPDTKEMLRKIIEEETRHAKELEELLK